MVVTIHQPAYIPWLGYFDRILRSDIYVFLDTVQYEKNSYINRNRIKNSQGGFWLTIPLKSKGHMQNKIKDLLIDDTQHWKKKHLKSIYLSYRKASFFDDFFPKLETLYKSEFASFSDLAYSHLMFWLKELGIDTKVVKASDIPTSSVKSNLILELCTKLGATRYISGKNGRNYLDKSSFIEKSIQIEYQNYRYLKYPQVYGPFLPNLSVVDFWMNSNQVNLIAEGNIGSN